MAFDQNQLYVGWEIWSGSSSIDGQVYVLDATTGNQDAVYAHVAVESLAVGNGILAVNGSYKLQVYDTTTRTLLWHTSMTGSSSGPVISMQIVNNLVYAIFSNNNDISGAGQSYLAVYHATTGTLVWQSPTFPGDQLYRFAVDQNTVYFGVLATHNQPPFTGEVYAYNIQSKKLLWRTAVDGGAQEPFVVSNGLVYTVADNGSHKLAHLVALDETTGTIKWQQALPGAFLDSFALSNGVISLSFLNDTQTQAMSPSITGINAQNGQQLWRETQYGFSDITATA